MKKKNPFIIVWILLMALALAGAIIFIRHLTTGWMPDRTAFTLPLVNLPIYWYGIVIMGGIGMAAMVTARLMEVRAKRVFKRKVSAELRDQPIPADLLADEIRRRLDHINITTMGQLIYTWGLDPRRLELNKRGRAHVRKNLAVFDGVEDSWLDDAPWRQWDPEHVWSAIGWMLIFGLIGARLYHVFTPSPSMAAIGIESPADYFRNPGQLLNIRNGGLGIFGGIAGAMLGTIIYSRRNAISWLKFADMIAVGAALAQAIGRWGNFFNQELYGAPTTLPWGLRVDAPLLGYDLSTQFHPAFLYESLWSLMTFFVLFRLARRRRSKLRTGELSAIYLVMYAVGRILLELTRLDSRLLKVGSAELPAASIFAFGMIVVVVTLVFARRKPAKK